MVNFYRFLLLQGLLFFSLSCFTQDNSLPISLLTRDAEIDLNEAINELNEGEFEPIHEVQSIYSGNRHYWLTFEIQDKQAVHMFSPSTYPVKSAILYKETVRDEFVNVGFLNLDNFNSESTRTASDLTLIPDSQSTGRYLAKIESGYLFFHLNPAVKLNQEREKPVPPRNELFMLILIGSAILPVISFLTLYFKTKSHLYMWGGLGSLLLVLASMTSLNLSPVNLNLSHQIQLDLSYILFFFTIPAITHFIKSFTGLPKEAQSVRLIEIWLLILSGVGSFTVAFISNSLVISNLFYILILFSACVALVLFFKYSELMFSEHVGFSLSVGVFMVILINSITSSLLAPYLYDFGLLHLIASTLLMVTMPLAVLNRIRSTFTLQKQALQSILEEEQHHNKLKNSFLNNISHELRTPLNAIVGFTDLLLQEDLKAGHQANLKTIKYSSTNLLNIVNDILDYSRLDEGKLKLTLNEFSTFDVIHSVSGPLQLKAEKKGLQLNLSIDETIPKRVVGDPYRLSQILQNLTDNAIKFTAKGSIKIEVSSEPIAQDQHQLTIKVSDTGIGIPDDHIKVIFESFNQMESDSKRRYSGTGIGLSIVKSLVELHRGQITVTSELGKGSEFTVTLSYKASSLEKDQSVVVPDIPESRSLRNQRILIVEDNLVNQMVAKQVLEKWHAQVEVAENGVEALEILKNETFDLILMDLMMPEMDGYEATSAIRQSGGTYGDPKIPIVALTADVMEGTRERVIKLGMNGYIAKPFNQDNLYGTIKRIL